MRAILILMLLPIHAAAASIGDLSPELREQLGIERVDNGWVHKRMDAVGERVRFLTLGDLNRLEPHLDKLAGMAERAADKKAIVPRLLGEDQSHESFGQRFRREHPTLGFAIPLGDDPSQPRRRGESRLDKSGALPVDWDGDRRGHVMPPDAEAGRVLAAGRTAVDVYGISSNYIYGGCKGADCYRMRYEGETIGVDLRRGFRVDGTPMELGLRLKAHKDMEGFQNGLIAAVEKALDAENAGRFGTPRQPPLPQGGYWAQGGRVIRDYDGRGSSVGDVYAQVKAAVLSGDGTGWAPRVAARVALNVATAADEFTRGNYVGAGVSVTQRLSDKITLNADVRATQSLDKKDYLGLPLKTKPVPGWTLAMNYALSDTSSWVLQLDKNFSPYQQLHLPFDAYQQPNDALSIGYTKIIKTSEGKTYFIQIWDRENVNYRNPDAKHRNPLMYALSSVRFVGNQAPDNQIGIRVGVLY